jgi:hypothetical protein
MQRATKDCCPDDNGWRVVWVWERGETPLSEILTSHEFWKLRMPLISVDGQALGAVVFYRHLFDGEPR